MADEWHDWLVSFDTDRIKDYIFATNNLKEIRGASALLASLDQERKNDLIEKFEDAAVAYSAGGGASVLLKSREKAEELIKQVEKAFRKETKTGSITGIWIKPEEKDASAQNGTGEKKFGERMKKAAAKLSLQKSRKAELAFMPVEPYFRLCDSCGQHPASKRAEDEVGDLLCESCFTKRKGGSQGRRSLYYKCIDYANAKEGKIVWRDEYLPEDLNAIGAVSHPRNYVGFIALDGNNMGQLLDKLPSKENYRKYSDGLVSLVEEITFDALRKYGQHCSKTAPFEIVLIGGDDVMLFTAADIAIPVAQFILEEFEKRSPQLMEKVGLKEKRLTMAAGIVLSHSNYPIPSMHSMAEALLKSAKRCCAKNGYQSSALDFEVISGSGSSLDTAREGLPHRRPYDLLEIGKLLDHICKLKAANFPASQLHAMYQALFDELPGNGTMATLRVLGRAKREHREPLEGFFTEFIPPTTDPMILPWSTWAKEKSKCRSPLVDLVDLYPFVHD